MVWFILHISFVIVALGLGFWIATKTVGREAIRRTMRYSIPWLILGFAIAFSAPMLVGSIPLIGKILAGLYIIGVITWLVSWPYRKRRAGLVLLDVGRTAQNKLVFWIGLFEGLVALYLTWQWGFDRALSTEAAALNLVGIVLWWTLTTFFIALGLNKLELRENGICFLYTFIAWQRMQSYRWARSKPTTLMVQFKALLPGWPGFMSIAVPPYQREPVEHIVATHVENSEYSPSNNR